MVKNMPAKTGGTGDVGLIPGLGGSPGVEKGNPPQYSSLENSMKKSWQATVHGAAKSQAQLSMLTHVPGKLIRTSHM